MDLAYPNGICLARSYDAFLWGVAIDQLRTLSANVLSPCTEWRLSMFDAMPAFRVWSWITVGLRPYPEHGIETSMYAMLHLVRSCVAFPLSQVELPNRRECCLFHMVDYLCVPTSHSDTRMADRRLTMSKKQAPKCRPCASRHTGSRRRLLVFRLSFESQLQLMSLTKDVFRMRSDYSPQ